MIAVALILLGLFLSAFFSGSETGFYRVTRVRLAIDARTGSWIARCLLWLVLRPTVVIATVLIGNNIANYLVSMGLVLASQSLLGGFGEPLQAALPVLATPLLFIYGELLPKFLYYNAPYYFSTRGAPLLVAFAGLFLPLSSIVIGLEALWQRWFRKESIQAKYSLERQELQRVMMEGQEAGILLPTQREIAQNLFTFGVRPIRQFAIPLRALTLVKADASRPELVAAARRSKIRVMGILKESGKQLQGCYSVADVVTLAPENLTSEPVITVQANDTCVQVLSGLQSRQSPLAQVTDARGTVIGVVTKERLISLLLPEN